jgi:hypothetical protein
METANANTQEESEEASENLKKPLKDTEAFKKAQVKANKALKVKPATLLSRLEKKYGKARMAKLVDITAKDLKALEENREKYKNAKTEVLPDRLEWTRQSQVEAYEEAVERLEENHHTLAALTATMEQLEEDADNAQPLPRWVAVQFPELAKKSITKLAEPLQVKLDGAKALAQSIVEKYEPAQKKFIEERMLRRKGEEYIKELKRLGMYDDLVKVEQQQELKNMPASPENRAIMEQAIFRREEGATFTPQLITRTETGSARRFPEQFMEQHEKALQFINRINEIPVNDCMVANRADIATPGKSESYDRAFALSRPTAEKYPALYHGRPRIFVSNKDKADVHVHEIGHIIEQNDPYVADMVNMFLDYRVQDEKPVPLQKVLPGYGYDKWETGRKDHFDRYFDLNGAYYCGKNYETGSTEILSMGLQELYTNPAKFMQLDPEYAQFVISIVQYMEGKKAKGGGE